jgi:hypothetical protein
MARGLAVAYGFAGAVVAAAVIVVAGSTVGLTGDGADAASASVLGATVSEAGLGVVPAFGAESGVADSQVVTTATGEQVEYVYVDQPAVRGSHDDDDDRGDHERDRDDDDEDHEHEDDD